MGIKVDKEKCVGCGRCADECPGDVIRMDRRRKLPYNKYKNDCWYCGVCEQECPTGAAKMEFPCLIV